MHTLIYSPDWLNEPKLTALTDAAQVHHRTGVFVLDPHSFYGNVMDIQYKHLHAITREVEWVWWRVETKTEAKEPSEKCWWSDKTALWRISSHIWKNALHQGLSTRRIISVLFLTNWPWCSVRPLRSSKSLKNWYFTCCDLMRHDQKFSFSLRCQRVISVHYTQLSTAIWFTVFSYNESNWLITVMSTSWLNRLKQTKPRSEMGYKEK